MKPQTITKNGFDVHECISAIQKAVRRGEEDKGVYFALEIESVGWWNALVGRLRVICQEDIGVGDMMAVTFAINALDQADAWYKVKNDAWKLGIVNAIIALSRAKKSRVGVNLVIHGDDLSNRKAYEMMDVALDRHTWRGRRMKRNWTHFFAEGAVLKQLPKEYYDEQEKLYEREAIKRLLKRDEQTPQEDLF